jgi:hypothetical protein
VVKKKPVPVVWLRCRSCGLMVQSLIAVLEMRGHIDSTGNAICAGTEFTIMLHLEPTDWQANTVETERRAHLWKNRANPEPRV